MAVKQEITQSNLLTEYAASGLNINHGYQMGQVEPTYNVTLGYSENEFLVDADGKKTRLISSGRNPKNVFFPQSKVLAFYATPMKKEDGTETTLGEFLAELMDAEVLADINNPVVAPGPGLPAPV